MSITDPEAVESCFRDFEPDYCINCAAYTAVDKAEEAAAAVIATQINADAVELLARTCTAHNTKLVHISTDYVFDGTAHQPYRPDAATNPVSVYGATKLKGEQLAAAHTDAVIIRTAWVYSSFGKNFVKTMLRLMSERPAINVVSDQQGSPTYARDLAAAILDLVSKGKWVAGIYHYTNEGTTTWYDFAVAIKNLPAVAVRCTRSQPPLFQLRQNGLLILFWISHPLKIPSILIYPTGKVV